MSSLDQSLWASPQPVIKIISFYYLKRTEFCTCKERLSQWWKSYCFLLLFYTVMYFLANQFGHSKGFHDQKITISLISSELLIVLQANLIIEIHHQKWTVLWKDWIAVFRVKVTAKVQNVNVCLDMFWIAEPFVTKLDMMMQHQEWECHLKRLICYLQGQGHFEGL